MYPVSGKHIKIASITTLVVVLAFSCTNDLKKVQAAWSDDKVPSSIAHDIVSIYSDSGQVRFEMRAPSRYDYRGDNPYSEMPDGISMRFYNEEKQTYSTLTADYALFKDKQGIVITRGNVRIIGEDSSEIMTQELTMDDKNQVIYTDEAVTIRTANQNLHGVGLWAKRDFSSYRILVPEGDMTVEEEK